MGVPGLLLVQLPQLGNCSKECFIYTQVKPEQVEILMVLGVLSKAGL